MGGICVITYVSVSQGLSIGNNNGALWWVFNPFR